MHGSRAASIGWLLLLTVAISAGAATPEPRAAEEQGQKGPLGPQEAEVRGVLVDPESRQPLVVLEGKRDRRRLVLAIGPFEANGIALPLHGVTPPRPLTHDLMLRLLSDVKVALRRVVITDLRDDVYYAELHLDIAGAPRQLDSRPSDAIALALRARVPILVEDRVFELAERAMNQRAPTPHF
jgi:bifunctional DNase/RNase